MGNSTSSARRLVRIAIAALAVCWVVAFGLRFAFERVAWSKTARISYDEQAQAFLRSSPSNPFIGNIAVDSASRARCRFVLDSIGPFALLVVDGSPSQEAAFSTVLSPCRFTLGQKRPFRFSAARVSTEAALIALALVLTFAGGLYIRTYPHVGWRRVATALGAVAGVGLLVLLPIAFADAVDWWVAAGAAVPLAVVVAVSVPATRDIVSWIQDGFHRSEPTDGAA